MWCIQQNILRELVDYIQAINIFGYWLQILILGVVAFGLWAFLGIAWKTKEEEGFLDGWFDGWKFALFLTLLGFVVLGIFSFIGFDISLADLL